MNKAIDAYSARFDESAVYINDIVKNAVLLDSFWIKERKIA